MKREKEKIKIKQMVQEIKNEIKNISLLIKELDWKHSEVIRKKFVQYIVSIAEVHYKDIKIQKNIQTQIKHIEMQFNTLKKELEKLKSKKEINQIMLKVINLHKKIKDNFFTSYPKSNE